MVALNTTLCRITVVGPDRKADLAVPPSMTVAALLPVLLRHTSTAPAPGDEPADGGWVLQRLGEAPFELAGTPETLDWLEGEELHLRRAEDPLPELDFDDLADGVATAVNRRADRWQPEYRRPLFVVMSAVALAAVAVVLVGRGPLLAQLGIASGLSIGLLVAALTAGHRRTDPAVGLLFALGSALLAALAASSAVDGDPATVSWTAPATLAGAVAALIMAGVLIIGQRTVAPGIPFAPLLVVGVTATVVAGVLMLRDGMAMTADRASAVAAAAVLTVIVLAPRAAVKFSRLRGPQLPKTGADMAYDVEPASAEMVHDRTEVADTYLTVALATSALVLPVLFGFAVSATGWSGWTLVLVISGALLLRSRTFLGLWQRLALVAAGTVGFLMVIKTWSEMLPDGGRYVLLGGLVALMVPLVSAALRPWPRRMLPFWEYAATFFDVVTGVAVLPVLAQTLGLYSWARGLFG